jgi:NAD(P)H-dependent FMN reductase
MTTKPRIAVVIGSTRPGRYADKAAGWMLKQAQARDDIEAELLDLLDHPLPFFDEKGPLMSMPSENAEALRWQKTLARYDGFVFVVAEYNHSITGVLKNALDQAYKEWGRKPFTAIGYGGNGRRGRSSNYASSRLHCEWFRPRPSSTLAAPISC